MARRACERCNVAQRSNPFYRLKVQESVIKTFEIAGLPRDEVSRFVAGTHADPFRVLGPHRVGDDLEI
jgi:hypothetical protein